MDEPQLTKLKDLSRLREVLIGETWGKLLGI